jgi:hypothetical protein
MRQPVPFCSFYARLTADQRITAWHVSLGVAILYLWYQQEQNPVAVTRKALMKLARMQSCMTYHKCIRQLQAFGYISYHPSFHPRSGSQVLIIFRSGPAVLSAAAV